jgi:CheY-like chemotaxis protein
MGALTIYEADDGHTALQMVQKVAEEGEAAGGGHFDFILLDFYMVLWRTSSPTLPYPNLMKYHNEQLKLHGPETSSILRNQFSYTGYILGEE